jgi:plastocyanin
MLLAALALAIALPPGCSGRGSDVMTPPGGADVVITIIGMNGGLSFTPNPASVQVGQTVAWHNADSMTHTATQDGGGFDTGGIARGATSAPVVMGSAGTLDYHCSIHPSMTGTLDVTN